MLGIEARSNIAAFVKHRLVNGFMVGGMGHGLAQHFALGGVVRKRAAVAIEGQMGGAKRGRIPGLKLAGVCRGKLRRVGIGHIVNEIHFPRPEGRQADPVCLFGAAFNGFQIGQVVAFCIGFKVILEAFQTRHRVALPLHKLERPAADGVLVGLRFAVRRHQVTRIERDIGGQNRTGLMQV